jgi:hypothetical protein
MNAAEGANFVVGDALWDENATPRKYRVVAISTDDLSVVDSEGVGEAPDNSGTSSAAAKRYYNGSTPMTDWESELDDTPLYSSGINAIGECYNDSAFDESISISNGTDTVGLGDVTLTVASGEKHDGTEGTGARIVRTSGGSASITLGIKPQNNTMTVEWLEIDHNGNRDAGQGAVYLSGSGGTLVTYRVAKNLIVHGVNGANRCVGIYSGLSGGTGYIFNCFVYDISSTFDDTVYAGSGIFCITFTEAYNCSVIDTDRGFVVSGANITATNIISCDASDTDDFNLLSSPVASYLLSSDTSATGTGSLTSKASSDQFVSTVAGSEDLHLKAGADAIDVGSDLGTTPTDVNIDINGNDREGYLAWSMGAHNYALNIDDQVLVSIGQGTSHDSTSLTISSVVGTGPYLVSMNAAEGANFVVGDALWDENATPRKYRVVAISTDDLSVVDSEGVGEAPDNSGTSSAAAKRYYNGSTPMTDWESELDNTPLYSSGIDALGECYNDAAFDESVTIDGGLTVGLNTFTLTAATGEQHDGTEGTGVRIVNGATSSGITLSVSSVWDSNFITISDIEIDRNGYGIANNKRMVTAIDRSYLFRMILHGSLDTSNGTGVCVSGFQKFSSVANCIIYDLKSTAINDEKIFGINMGRVGFASYCYNNTVFDLNTTSTDAGCIIRGITNAAGSVSNNISMDCTAGGGTAEDFSGTQTGNNLSSDSTASGTGSLTSKTAANQFVSTTAGSEDLHLKSGADAIGAGTDLGTTPDGVNIDIDGFDRNSIGVTWDIGADQFVTAVSNISSALVAFFLDF